MARRHTTYRNRHTIWTNNLVFSEWKDDLREEYPELSDDELMEKMYEINNWYLDDERINLNIQLSQPIIVIADLGRWNGRVPGYKDVSSGNIRDCLYSSDDYVEWYVDAYGNLRCDGCHHDGTNHYLYRVFKDGVSEYQINEFKDKIVYGTVDMKDITRLTRRLGDEIAAVYGFDIPFIKKRKSA